MSSLYIQLISLVSQKEIDKQAKAVSKKVNILLEVNIFLEKRASTVYEKLL